MPYIDLDAVDLRILSALQGNGRLSNNDLADMVGLSPSPCLRRLRRLEERGFIAGYRAVVDAEMVGLGLTVFAEIKIEQHCAESTQQLHRALQAMPEVVRCHMIAGRADCLAELIVQNVKAYERILNEKLLALPMVADIRSTFALSEVKKDAPLPLTHLKRPHPCVPRGAPDC